MSGNSKQPLLTDLNIVLLGKTGSGKSASGNTILGGGSKAFTKDCSASSVTKICRIEKTNINEQKINVIDTVGLPDTTKKFTDVQPKIEQIFACADHGVDVFLLVIKLGDKFTEESRKVVKCIQDSFGARASEHTLVLFTHGDQLNRKIEDYIKESPLLRSVVNQYSRRYHVFNNEYGKQSQVTELLEKIKRIREKKGYRRYTDQDYKKIQDEILKEKSLYGAALVVGGGVLGGVAGCALMAGKAVVIVAAGAGAAAAGAAAIGFGLFLARKYVCNSETEEDRNKKLN